MGISNKFCGAAGPQSTLKTTSLEYQLQVNLSFEDGLQHVSTFGWADSPCFMG